MSLEIKIDYNVYEQLYQKYEKMSELLQQNVAELANAQESVSDFFIKGNAQKNIIESAESGIQRYQIKMKDMAEVYDVARQYVQVTFETLMDMDKMLAVKILEAALVSEDVSEEEKQAIRANPDKAHQAVVGAIQAEREMGGAD